MPLQFLFLVLRSRIVLITFVIVATIAVSVYFSATQPNRYVASASLLLNFVSDNPFDDTTVAPQLAASYMATQVDIIGSRTVALQVIDDLQLASSPEHRSALVGKLRSNLEVEPSSDSRLIHVRYEASTPEEAARRANAFASAYVTAVQNLSLEPAKRNAARFDVQIGLIRARLAGAQSELTQYQQQHGIVAVDERLDTETQRLRELSDALLQAQASARDVRARQLGINHPEYIRATRAEVSLQQVVDQQKARVMELKQQRAQLGVLAREVEIEQQTYDTALQSYYNEQMQSNFRNAGVDLLDPAEPPSFTNTPKFAMSVVGGLVLGSLLGMVLALLAELISRRLRTPESVEEMLDTRLINRV
jgi:uncharacterized protein involved in exopolysaccharide biosynthesis